MRPPLISQTLTLFHYMESFVLGVLGSAFAQVLGTLGWDSLKSSGIPLPHILADAYYERIRERYGLMNVYGMREALPLEDFYLATSLRTGQSADQRLTFEQLEARLLSPNHHRGDRLAAVDSLATEKRALVLGGPGAGKTTLLKHIARESTKGVFGESAIPVMLQLKRYQAASVSLRTLITQEFEVCRLPQPTLFINAALNSGRMLLLLDGLDEADPESIPRLVSELRDLVDQYPKSRYLIACRSGAYQGWLTDFREYEVLALEPAQIRHFVERWFEGTGTGAACLRDLSESPHLLEMASTPLLLTLLCIAYERKMLFAPTKTEVYSDALDALLDRWDSTSAIKRQHVYKELTTKRKNQLFSMIASKAFRERRVAWRTHQIVGEVEDFMRNIDMKDAVEGRVVIEAIETQHGIIHEASAGLYAFSHIAFQEYYTALHIVESGFPAQASDELLSHAEDDSWGEVLALASGMMRDATEWLDALTNNLRVAIDKLDLNSSSVQALKSIHFSTSATPVLSRSIALNSVMQQLISRATHLDRLLSSPDETYTTFVRYVLDWGRLAGFEHDYRLINEDGLVDLTTSQQHQLRDELLPIIEARDTIKLRTPSLAQMIQVSDSLFREYTLNYTLMNSSAFSSSNRWWKILIFGSRLDHSLKLIYRGVECVRAGSFMPNDLRREFESRVTDSLPRWLDHQAM